MANITIYDTSGDDEAFFKQALSDQTVTYIKEPLAESNAVANAEIVSVFVSSKVTRECINKLGVCKLLATRSTGFDHIDAASTKEKGIIISTVPTYGEHTVAEYAFGLLLSLTRKLPAAFEAAHEGSRSHCELEGTDLNGKTFGVIGAGKIGRNTASIAKGFGMRVLAYDPFPNQEAAGQIGYEYMELNDLLSQSDVISLHVPYTPENHHLLNTERLALIKKSAILINTARGELVDSKALVECVTNGRIAGVALDVMENEELINPLEELALLRAEEVDSRLLEHSVEINVLKSLPNVLITSHNAFNTKEAIQRINQITVDNIHAFLSGKPQNIVPA